MRLSKRIVYDIVGAPTLRGNGPHEADFKPVQIHFDGVRWVGLAPGGNSFTMNELDTESKFLWQEVIDFAEGGRKK